MECSVGLIVPWDGHLDATTDRKNIVESDSLALASMFRTERVQSGGSNPLSGEPGHFGRKATSVICLFMSGGPSQIETLDPKPLLNWLHGQLRPAEFQEVKYQQVRKDALLFGTRRRFMPHGDSGTEVSDLFPHTARCIDDIAVLRGCYGQSCALGSTI